MTPSLTMNWKMLITLVANTDGSVTKRGKGQLFFIDSVNHISDLIQKMPLAPFLSYLYK